MDQVSTLLQTAGYGDYVKYLLAVVGIASALSTVYPSNWPGAKLLHWVALLKGNATPAVVAGSTSSSVK